VDKLAIQVLSIDTTQYWDGTGWTGGQKEVIPTATLIFSTWFAVNPGTWSYSSMFFADGRMYNIQTTRMTGPKSRGLGFQYHFYL